MSYQVCWSCIVIMFMYSWSHLGELCFLEFSFIIASGAN